MDGIAVRLTVLGASTLIICGSMAATAQAAPAPAAQTDAAASAQVSAAKSAKKYGTTPQWVQRPYLHKSGKKFVVKGSLLADLYRPTAKGSKKKDSLKVRIRVAKTGKVSVGQRRDIGLVPVHLLAGTVSKALAPKPGKVTSFAVQLPKKASRQLGKVGKAKRMAAVAVTLDHRKDTDKTAPRGLVQITPGPLAKGKYGAKKLRTQTRMARLKVRHIHHPKAPLRSKSAVARSLAGTIGNEPWFNQIVVANGSPFIQQVNVNPNIQCMWTGSDPNANLASSVSNVYPGTQVQFSYPYTTASSTQPGLTGATQGINAPGTQGAMVQDLIQAGVAAGQQALADVANPETYGEGGMLAAIGGVVLTFADHIFRDYLDGTSSCNDVSTYPELFGVSTTVTGLQNFSSWEALSPEQWSALPDGTQYSNVEGGGGTQGPTQAWIDANLKPLLGAQTAVTYYWNGGQPAAMVSNNAASGSYIGGFASYQGGLFQFAGPNPGNPSTVAYWNRSGPQTSSANWSSNYQNCLWGVQTNDNHYNCTMNDGSVFIQLGMLSNPLYNSGLWLDSSTGGPAQPIVTVNGSSTTGYSITCEIPNVPPNPPTTAGNVMAASFQLPFAANGNTPALQGGALTSAVINSSGSQPSSAYYNISFFAQTEDGDFVYAKDSVQSPDANGLYTPNLGPNAGTAQIYLNNPVPNSAIGTLTPADLNQLVTWDGPGSTPQSVSVDDVAQVGCSVAASLNLEGLDITNQSSSFGNDWPMPKGTNGGWPSTVPSSNYNFSWMTPVEALNLSFQSMPVGNSVPVSSSTTSP